MHHPDRLRFVSLPRRFPFRAPSFAPAVAARRSPQARPFGTPAGLMRRLSSTECMGSPRFLGNPRALAPLSDPGVASRARPLRRAGAASAFRTASAHPNLSFRGCITRLSHSLSTLRGLDYSRTRARLASGWRPAFTGQARVLRGCSGRFPCHELSVTFPPPPGFAWRDLND